MNCHNCDKLVANYECGGGCGAAYCGDACARSDWPHDPIGRRLSRAKAREILHHGSVHGHPLTDRQRRYFGWIASGGKE